jgi:tape measure domain-containing protein
MAAQIGSMFVSLTADIKPFATDMARAASITQSTAASINKSMGATERSLDRLRGGMSHRNTFSPGRILAASRAFDSLNSRTDLLRAALLTTTAAFGGLAAAMTSNVLLRYADTATKLSNQLRVVSKDSADLAAQQAAIAASANDARASLSASATLYSRIRKSAPERSAEAALRVTNTIQKALQLGGASAQESASAMLQLSQGLASNRLGGEELRAVLETPLGLELAKGIGVTIGEFREMGHTGQLTADVILNALERIGPEIDKQFSQSVKTLDQALTVADNNITLYLGSVNNALGITTKLGDGIVYVSEHLEELGLIAAAVGGTLAAAFASRLAVRTVGGFGGQITGAVAAFKVMKEASRDAVDAATRDLDDLSRRMADVQAARANASIKNVFAGAAAPTAAIKEYQQAIAAVRKAEDDLAKSTQNLTGLTVQYGQVGQNVSTKAIGLAEKEIAAYRRLVIEKQRLREVTARLESAQFSSGRILDRGDATYDEKKGMLAQNKATIDSLTKQAGGLARSIGSTENQIAVYASRIAAIQVEADRKAAEERVALARRIADQEIEIQDRKSKIIAARARADVARATVDTSGAAAVSAEIAELNRQYEGLARAQGEAQTKLDGLTSSMEKASRATTFLRAQGSAILGLFGGPWGAALTGAIVALGYYSAEAAAAQQASENFNTKLREMGLLASEAEEKVKSLGEAQAEAARNEVRMAEEQIASRRDALDQLRLRAELMVSPLAGAVQEGPRTDAIRGIISLIEAYSEGKIAADEARESIAKLTSADYGKGVDDLSLQMQGLLKELAAADKALPKFKTAAEGATRDLESTPVGRQDFSSMQRAMEGQQALTSFTAAYREEMGRTGREAKIYAEQQRILKDAADAEVVILPQVARALAEQGIALQETAEKYQEVTSAIEQALSAAGNMNVDAFAIVPTFDTAELERTAKLLNDIAVAAQIPRVSDANLEAAFINPYAAEQELAYLENRRAAINKSSEAAQRAAYIQEELTAAIEAGQSITREQATAFADMRLALEEEADKAIEAAEANREFNQTLSEMIGLVADYTVAVNAVPTFSAGEDARAQKMLEDARMAAALRRQMEADANGATFQDTINQAGSDPFGAVSLQHTLDKIVETAGKTSDEIAIMRDAEQIYQDAVARGLPITQALAESTARRAAAAREAADAAEEEAKKRGELLEGGVAPGIPKPNPVRDALTGGAFDDVMEESERNMRALEMQRAAMALSKDQADALRLAFERLNEVQRANGIVTDEQRQKIIEAAAQEAAFQNETERLADAQEDFAKSAVAGFENLASSIGRAIAEGGDFKDVLRQLIALAIDLLGKWAGPKIESWLGNPTQAAVAAANGVPAGASATRINAAAVGDALSRSTAIASNVVTPAMTANIPGTTSRLSNNAGLVRPSRFNSAVDPRLMDILNTAASNFPMKVEAISGFRPGDPRYHGKGLATDVQIYDQAGKALGNYQDASSFRTYEQFAQQARAVQMAKYPELNDSFRWGGYFSGPKGKYGALDTMHFDLGGAGMAGGSWAGGLTPQQQGMFPGAMSMGMSDSATDASVALTTLADNATKAGTGLGDLTQSVVQAAGSSGAGGPMDLGAMTVTGGAGQGIAGAVTQAMSGLGDMVANFFTGGGFTNLLTGLFSALFSGGFAEGGYTGPGKFALVGEDGPELIAGGRHGKTVIPMSPMDAASSRAGSVVKSSGWSQQMTSYRGGDLIVQGNVTEDVLPKVEAMIKESNARERSNFQRSAGQVNSKYQKLRG